MRIAYAIPVRGHEQLADGTFLAIGIETDVYRIQTFPAPLRVPFLLALAGPHVEAGAGKAHMVQLSVLGPDLAPACEPMTAGFELSPGENSQPGWEARAVIPAAAIIETTVPGTYSIEITVEHNSVSVPIQVLQA